MISNNSRELGLIFVYVFAFGISDFLVKKYIVSDQSYIMYYVCIGVVGLFLIFNNNFKSGHFNSEKG
jgi:hypothetical protein